MDLCNGVQSAEGGNVVQRVAPVFFSGFRANHRCIAIHAWLSPLCRVDEGRSSKEYVSYATDADRSGNLTVFVPQFGLTASTTFHDRKMAAPVLASESSAFLEAVQTVGRSCQPQILGLESILVPSRIRRGE